jgi:hypothetical protein
MREETRRSRLTYATAALFIPSLGVVSRWLPWAVPEPVAANMGDTLGALTAFLVVGLVFPTAATWQAAVAAFASSAVLGAIHWYQVPHLDAARVTALGGLFLARVSTPLHLGCCAAGIGLGMVAEWLVLDN